MNCGKYSSVGKTGWFGCTLLVGVIVSAAMPRLARAQNNKKPNILVIMGDDVGWFNIGAYNQGMMSGKTPHLDQLAREGMRFTDYYAQASCTAGRAAFITGELPIRTGLTTVGPTSTQCPIRTGSIIRKAGSTSTALAISCTAGQPTPTTQPYSLAGERSESKESWMKARWHRSRTWKTCRTGR